MIDGMARSDGPTESMLDGQAFIAPVASRQRRELYLLYERYGALTDWEVFDLWPQEYEIEILKASVDARRDELIIEGLVDDSGAKAIGSRSTVPIIKWDLISRIPADQIKKNVIRRRKRRKGAWEFAMSLAEDPTQVVEFMTAWTAKDWPSIDSRWPAFGITDTPEPEGEPWDVD